MPATWHVPIWLDSWKVRLIQDENWVMPSNAPAQEIATRRAPRNDIWSSVPTLRALTASHGLTRIQMSNSSRCGTDSASMFVMVDTRNSGESSATSNYNIACGSVSGTLSMAASTAMASEMGVAVGDMGPLAMPSSPTSMSMAPAVSISTVTASMSTLSTTLYLSPPTARPVHSPTPVGEIVGGVVGGQPLSWHPRHPPITDLYQSRTRRSWGHHRRYCLFGPSPAQGKHSRTAGS